MLLRRWPELVAAAGALLLFLPALRYGFVFDDASLLDAAGNPQPLGGLLPYRPLRYASYLVDAALGGSAAVYHGHNLLLHALNSALVVAIARRLGAAAAAACAAALVVAAHPFCVEAVVYIAGRRDLLCVSFGLAAVLAALSGRPAAASALLLLGVAAKESALVFALPLLVALRPSLPGWMPLLRASTAFAAAALLLLAAYGSVGPWLPPIGVEGLALFGRTALHYLSGIFLLRDFAPEYPALAGADAAAAHVAAAAALLLLLAVALPALLRRQSRQALLAGWLLSGFAALSLWGGLHEPGADRHAFLLLPPLAVALALLVSPLLGGTSPLRAGAALALVLVFAGNAAASRAHMKHWQSEATLWSYAVAQPSVSPRARANFARVLAGEGRLDEARAQLRRAVAADRSDPLLYLSRAALRCAEGRKLRARRDLAAALRLGVATPAAAAAAQEIGAGISAGCRA